MAPPTTTAKAVKTTSVSGNRNFVYTANNYTADTEAALQALKSRYHVYGKEVGEGTETVPEGTPHLQAAIIFPDAKSLSAAIKTIQKAHPGAHVEVARDIISATAYCQKGTQPHAEWEELGTEGPTYGTGADVYQDGKPPVSKAQQGENNRERYKRAWEAAKAGNLDDIDEDIRMRHYATIKKIKADYQTQPQSVSEMDFHWYYGDSGTGKSRTAREENPVHYLKLTNKWWDGYDGQPCVIIDEWSPSHEMLADHMKKWCDHHPFCSETKGSAGCLRPPRIIVTSNYSIQECFPKPQDHLPLLRRFKVKHFGDHAFQPAATAVQRFGGFGAPI